MGRNKLNEKKDLIVNWIKENFNETTFVITYKQYEKYFRNEFQENSNIVLDNGTFPYFGNTKGKNKWAECNKMVQIGSGAYREQIDYKLTRYACYLIAQNGDSRKKVIALAQTYFAVQTRKQEITEKEYSLLTEDEKVMLKKQTESYCEYFRKADTRGIGLYTGNTRRLRYNKAF